MIILIAMFFKVDDMTLSKGHIYNFNKGWTFVREDVTKDSINKLPYVEDLVRRFSHQNTDEMEYFSVLSFILTLILMLLFLRSG